MMCIAAVGSKRAARRIGKLPPWNEYMQRTIKADRDIGPDKSP